MPYSYDKETEIYSFHDDNGTLIHQAKYIAIVYDSRQGIIKHGPTPEVAAWVTQQRQQSAGSGNPQSINMIESSEWDVKDLNKKLARKPFGS